uniref:Uncharacterized protein n=1 Tax=Plectus sambesii TaxID=2011161 RepID=A0A914VUT7_9BILA
MSRSKRGAKPVALASKDLPKVVSFFCHAADLHVDRTNYIIRPSEKKTLATIIADVATALHLSIDSNDLSVYDLNGSKIRSFRTLYDHAASTFILKSEANLELNGDIFEHAGIGPKLKQTKDRSTNCNWIYGNSGLIVKQSKPPKPPIVKQSKPLKPSKPEKGKKLKSRSQEKKNAVERSVTDTETELNTPHSDEAKSARKAENDAKGVATQQETTKEQQAIEKSSTVAEKRPCPVSQIEARLAQVRTLQDRMMEGESYLDKIGQRDPKQHRFNPFVLFGGGDIDWEDKKEAATTSSQRPPSAIPSFTIPIAALVDRPSDPEEAEIDRTSSTLSRPQTVVLRRPNPKLTEVPEVS